MKKKSKKRLSLFAEGKDKDKLLSNINNTMDNNINNNDYYEYLIIKKLIK